MPRPRTPSRSAPRHVARHACRALTLAALLAACSAVAPPVVAPALRDAEARTTLVFVPGITGSKLRDRASGALVWGRGANLLRPRDGGYALAAPIAAAADRAPRLQAVALLDVLRLFGGLVRKPIYAPVVALLVANGYRLGDLEAPRAEDSLYLFPYDWRQGNERTAQRLFARLEALRRARGVPRLRIDLLCQSNGAHVCRYLTKYGGAALDDAAAGRARPPAGLAVERMILVGTANGGSLRILREMNRGRVYVPLVGRAWLPETLFTFASLYQDLPAYRPDLFVDGAGGTRDVDLYDAAAWRRHGWSIYGRAAAARLARGRRSDLFADAQARDRYLARMLARARRFQQALHRDVPGFGRSRYYLIQNTRTPTPLRAALIRDGDRWQTLFTGDRALGGRPRLAALISTAGDGHAARESQLWLAPQESAALGAEPFDVDGRHFEMILEPAAHRRILDLLSRDATS